MNVHHVPSGKKLLPFLTVLLLVLSVLSVNMKEISAVEYPAIYMEPALITDPTLTPGTNFTVSIKTNYNGTDIWGWDLTLNYNPNVLHGGIRRTDMWTGNNITKVFNATGTPVVPDSEEVYVNGTLMTRKTNGTDTWTGDGVTKVFNATGTPVVPDSEEVYVNGTLMTRKTNGTDTWTGDGVTRKFYTTKKPLVEEGTSLEEVRVYVKGVLMHKFTDYTVNYVEGIIELFTNGSAPTNGSEIEADYYYGHYDVEYSEGMIKFYSLATPANGVEIEATYIYKQYAVDYSKGSITFSTAPSQGAKVEVTYLYGGITNGDLITKDKHSSAMFTAGTFNNTAGNLLYTYANFFYVNPPISVTSGPGTLANITFTVVGRGISNITLAPLKRCKDTWSGDGATTLFYTTKPIVSDSEEVYVNKTLLTRDEDYTINYDEGKITFTTAPSPGVEVKAIYTSREMKLMGYKPTIEEFYNVIDATTMPQHIGNGYFSNLPSIYVDPATIVDPNLTPDTNFTVSIFTDYYNETEDVWGWEFTLTYNPGVLQGIEVTNGDLITTDKDPDAQFTSGTFDNEAGKLSLTEANFSDTEMPLPVTSGPGTLATVTFTVVGRGTSDITLGPETKLIGMIPSTGEEYNIIDYTMPDQIRNSFFDNTVHDIAVTSVTASPDVVKIGEPVSINVTVTNEGDFSETFDVTAYYDNTAIGTQSVIDLAALNEAILTFTWDTTGVTPGGYTITAEAILAGDDDTTDNTFTDGTVKIVKLPVASFTYSPENPVTNQVVTFDASLSTPNSGTITSYAWDFGDGTSDSGAIVEHAYTSAGTYNVTLTITDSEGLTDTTADTVTVEEPPLGIPWYLYVAAAGAAAIIIAAIAFYFLRIKKPKPT